LCIGQERGGDRVARTHLLGQLADDQASGGGKKNAVVGIVVLDRVEQPAESGVAQELKLLARGELVAKVLEHLCISPEALQNAGCRLPNQM
jgi:hypothetical protein